MLIVWFLLLLVSCSSARNVTSADCKFKFDSALKWTANCSKMNLTVIPSLQKNQPINRLIISQNNFTSLTNFTEWSYLHYLDISHNNIRRIDRHFKALTNLNNLDLSYNRIEYIDLFAFEHLHSLRVLDLSGNPLLATTHPKFLHAINPKYLIQLTQIHLSGVGLSEVPQELFQHHHLVLLDLSSNKIKRLVPFPKTLVSLDLSKNLFERIDSEIFVPNSHLRVLHMEDNKNLKLIQFSSFHCMSELRFLSFEGCSLLDHVPADLFHHDKQLEYFSIAHCNFQTISLVFKSHFLKIKHLKLHGNPWHCDSRIKWFKFLNATHETNNDLRCASPVNTTMATYYGIVGRQAVLHQLLWFLICLCLLFFIIGGFGVYRMEKQRRMAANQPYTLVGMKPKHFHKPVYVSTVI